MKITLYLDGYSLKSHAIKQQFDDNKTPYEYIDVNDNADARAKLIYYGYEHSPVIAIDDFNVHCYAKDSETIRNLIDDYETEQRERAREAISRAEFNGRYRIRATHMAYTNFYMSDNETKFEVEDTEAAGSASIYHVIDRQTNDIVREYEGINGNDLYDQIIESFNVNND